jgi:pre-mRNA-processing factor 19
MGITPVEDVEMEEDANAMPDDTKAIIEETLAALSAGRKKRKMVDGYVTIDDVRGFAPKQSIPSLHASSPAGINAIDVSSKSPSVFVTGGNDKVVQVYDADSQKVLHTLKGHTKKVNHVLWREDDAGSLILSASVDKTARVWGYDEPSSTYAPRQTFKTHKGDVTGIGIHPSKKLAALASADKTFSVHDLTTLQTVFHSAAFDSSFHSLAFHPDGHFIGVGTANSSVFIIDLRSGEPAAELKHAGDSMFPVHTLAFSENGWQMAAPGSAEGDIVSLWDLKKQKATLQLDLGEGFRLRKVTYDYSAQFLGIGGAAGARIFLPNKTKEEVWRHDGDAIADLTFGHAGKSFWAVSGRAVKVWGVI